MFNGRKSNRNRIILCCGVHVSRSHNGQRLLFIYFFQTRTYERIALFVKISVGVLMRLRSLQIVRSFIRTAATRRCIYTYLHGVQGPVRLNGLRSADFHKTLGRIVGGWARRRFDILYTLFVRRIAALISWRLHSAVRIDRTTNGIHIESNRVLVLIELIVVLNRHSVLNRFIGTKIIE